MLLLLLAGCDPKLERPGVAVWAEVRYAEQDLPAVMRQVDTLAKLGYAGAVITIPLSHDAAGNPVLPQPVRQDADLDTVFRPALPLAFAYTAHHPDSLFRAGALTRNVGWMRTLGELVQQTAGRHLAKAPEWIVLGQDFEPLEDAPGLWASLLDSLRPHFPGTRFTYAARPDRLRQIGFWNSLDAVGVLADHPANGQYKPYARTTHAQVAAVARAAGKPVFVASANLIGKDKLLKFRNLLRFWPDDVALAGINLNTIYPVPAPRDTVQSFFGFRGDRELESYLHDYLQSAPPAGARRTP